MSADPRKFLALLTGRQAAATPSNAASKHAIPNEIGRDVPRFALEGADVDVSAVYAIALTEWHTRRIDAAFEGVAFNEPAPTVGPIVQQMKFSGPAPF